MQRSSVSLTYVIRLSSVLIKSIIIDWPRRSEINGWHMRGLLVIVECVTLQAIIEHALVNQRHTGIGELVHELRLTTTSMPSRNSQRCLLRHLVLLNVVRHLALVVHHQIFVHFLVMCCHTAVACSRCNLLIRDFGIIVLVRHGADLPRIIVW